MSDEYAGLASAVDKFKEAVNRELKEKNAEFHSALNDEEPIKFMGIGSENERNEYLVEPSDVLFWHDPIGYLDELERWKGQKILDEHLSSREFLNQSDQVNQFSRLVEAIKRRRVTPFVGAGLSRPFRLPLWGEALTKLVTKLEGVSQSDQRAMLPALEYLEEVKALLSKYDYIAAAEMLYSNHKTRLENFILNTFDGSNIEKFFGPVSLLPQLSDGCVITTNFDNLIERVFLSCNRAIEGYMHGTQSQNLFASKLIQGDRCILKLHGNYGDPETYIFSKSQYDNAYGENGPDYTKTLSKVLRQIFISHSLLFLGCSLESDRTLDLFIDVVNSNTFDIPPHFALLPEPSNHESKLSKEDSLMKAKIHCIWYRLSKNEKGEHEHTQLEELLRYAIACASGKAKI